MVDKVGIENTQEYAPMLPGNGCGENTDAARHKHSKEHLHEQMKLLS